MTMTKTVGILGAAGAQASGVIEGLARADTPLHLVLCDRAVPAALADAVGPHTSEILEFDLIQQPDVLDQMLKQVDLVINCTGPYFILGPRILDAAIAQGTDYLDICDDLDATKLLLDRDAAATRAGVRALVGMGSAPGTTNILVKLALDALPDGDASVEITWCVDALDMNGAVVPHFAHSFSTVDPELSGTPEWEDLNPHYVDFPEPVGRQLTVRLSHPELFTLPLHTRVVNASNYGGVTPPEFTHLGWISSRFTEGPGKDKAILHAFSFAGEQLLSDHERVGSGLIVDVRVGASGYRFEAGGTTKQEEATGTPAAAGALMMLANRAPATGVFPAECLEPRDFFSALRVVSQGGGGLGVQRTENGVAVERVRIRDLMDLASDARPVHEVGTVHSS